LVRRERYGCHCRFAELALFKARLGEYDTLIESETFDAEGAKLVLALPPEQWPRLQQTLADISRGRSELRLLDA